MSEAMDFNKIVDQFVLLKKKKEALDLEQKKLSEEIDSTEKTLMAFMEQNRLLKFSVPGIGTIYQSERAYVRTPKSPEEREAFFGYLKQIGEFNDLITVNSQTLNAWFKAKNEAAIDRGELLEVPGLKDIGIIKHLSLRKS